MVLRREAIEQRLKELDEILQELGKYREADRETLRRNLGQRWIVERGLIAAASIILDVADSVRVHVYVTDSESESLEAGKTFIRQLFPEVLSWRRF